MAAGGWLDPANYGPRSRQALGHTFRYYLARGFIRPTDHVLDVACGVGYGAKILSSVAARVSAFDLDQQALDIAERNYAADNIQYMWCDFDEVLGLPRADVVISFETIEHLESAPEHFVGLLKGAAERLIVVSAPVIPTVGINPHHRHDFTEDSLQNLMLDETWQFWEKVRQGPYAILVVYNERFGKVLG